MISTRFGSRRDLWCVSLIILMIAVGCLRIISTYSFFWQTWDEPLHIAAGMEWLDKGQYTYEPFHPPLARVMGALGPYLSGIRIAENAGTPWDEGNAILHARGAYEQNLTLARIGILPFFVIASVVVALWAKRCGGRTTALLATLLFTTMPPVLGHAGLATLDMACTAMVAVALFALVSWLSRMTPLRSVILGVSVGLAVLSKFSTLGFLLLAGGSTLALWYVSSHGKNAAERTRLPRAGHWITASAIALLLCALTIWAGYRFSSATLEQPETRPHEIVDRIVGTEGVFHDLSYSILENTPIPAPEFVKGIKDFIDRRNVGHLTYLFGQIRRQGYWYYFPIVFLLKTPLPFILLCMIGLFFIVKEIRHTRNWFHTAVPVAAAVSILVIGVLGHIDDGLRQFLSAYPLLAIMAGYGATKLLARGKGVLSAKSGLLAMLCCWQLISSGAAHPDYLAYFNELAGGHPERIVADSDLDWGQDLKRLALTLKRRSITDLAIDYNGSLGINLDQFDLPPRHALTPYQKETGWIAISQLSLRLGTGRAPYDQFKWLAEYQPVERVGKSIWLYYIPEN